MSSTNTNLALVSPSSLLSMPIRTATSLRTKSLKNQLTGYASQPTGLASQPTGLASQPTGLASQLSGLDNQLYWQGKTSLNCHIILFNVNLESTTTSGLDSQPHLPRTQEANFWKGAPSRTFDNPSAIMS